MNCLSGNAEMSGLGLSEIAVYFSYPELAKRSDEAVGRVLVTRRGVGGSRIIGWSSAKIKLAARPPGRYRVSKEGGCTAPSPGHGANFRPLSEPWGRMQHPQP